MRRKWAALPGLLTIAATAALLSAYQGASSPEGRAPEQPIAFPHPLHAAGSLNLYCLYCHYKANKSPTAGLMPSSAPLLERATRAPSMYSCTIWPGRCSTMSSLTGRMLSRD